MKQLAKDEMLGIWDALQEVFELFAAIAAHVEVIYETALKRLGLGEIERRVDFFERRRDGELWL